MAEIVWASNDLMTARDIECCFKVCRVSMSDYIPLKTIVMQVFMFAQK